MALILSIETATPICSVCVADGEKILSTKENVEGNQHASMLTLLIQACLQEAGKSINELEAVAVSKGPGSYTGLRVGVSTAKGLCYAMGIPLIGINTLASLAAGYMSRAAQPSLLIPMLDARRMEVYCAVFSPHLETVKITETKIIDHTSFQDILDQQVCYFIGSGALKCKDVIEHSNAHFDAVDCHAENMVNLAHQAFQQKQFEDVAYFEPFYLKDFVGKKA